MQAIRKLLKRAVENTLGTYGRSGFLPLDTITNGWSGFLPLKFPLTPFPFSLTPFPPSQDLMNHQKIQLLLPDVENMEMDDK